MRDGGYLAGKKTLRQRVGGLETNQLTGEEERCLNCQQELARGVKKDNISQFAREFRREGSALAEAVVRET